MIGDATSVLHRLHRLREEVKEVGRQSEFADQRRYLLSSAELVGREHDKLEYAIVADDGVTAAWALRSIADMMKGLIDIGSDMPDTAPALWQEAKDLAQQTHALERNARR